MGEGANPEKARQAGGKNRAMGLPGFSTARESGNRPAARRGKIRYQAAMPRFSLAGPSRTGSGPGVQPEPPASLRGPLFFNGLLDPLLPGPDFGLLLLHPFFLTPLLISAALNSLMVFPAAGPHSFLALLQPPLVEFINAVHGVKRIVNGFYPHGAPAFLWEWQHRLLLSGFIPSYPVVAPQINNNLDQWQLLNFSRIICPNSLDRLVATSTALIKVVRSPPFSRV